MAAVLLLGGAAVLSHVFFGSRMFQAIDVGVAVPEGEKETKAVLRFLSAMESAEAVCNFRYLPEDEAMESYMKERFRQSLYCLKAFMRICIPERREELPYICRRIRPFVCRCSGSCWLGSHCFSSIYDGGAALTRQLKDDNGPY